MLHWPHWRVRQHTLGDRKAIQYGGVRRRGQARVRGPVGACYTGRTGVFSSTRSRTVRRYDMAELVVADGHADIAFAAQNRCGERWRADGRIVGGVICWLWLQRR